MLQHYTILLPYYTTSEESCDMTEKEAFPGE